LTYGFFPEKYNPKIFFVTQQGGYEKIFFDVNIFVNLDISHFDLSKMQQASRPSTTYTQHTLQS